MVAARSNWERITSTTSKRRHHVLDVPLGLDRTIGNQSLQVHASLRSAILDGRLVAGLRLPSSRSLADQLSVRRNAIVGAYEHLLSDGLVEARIGDGTYVASRLPTRVDQITVAPFVVAANRRGAFALGQTHSDPVILRRLASATRRRIASATSAYLGYGDPRGGEELRRQIALHLAASRGIRCDPSCILIVSGTQQGVRLCADALLRAGDRVWMEDPGYPATRNTLAAAGMRLVPVPVDAEGIDVAAGRRLGPSAKAVYVTPSHQFPTGVTMKMERRIALLDWARASRAWVLEDDYDSEFRYGGPPLTALAGIDGADRVIYIGTFSKTLFAGLRLAYLVLPPAAVERVVVARAAHDRFPPSLVEGAVADLMADGILAAHVRRMRTRYRIARDAIASTLERAAGGTLRIVVPTQGLHMLAHLPAGLAKDAAAKIRAIAKIESWLLSETRLVQTGPDGFVLGFAGHDITELTLAANRLGQAVKSHLGPSPGASIRPPMRQSAHSSRKDRRA
jgi:GntR family transcriptional regulator/MocR family aminotransferase